jgi:hypothetical protein
MDWKYLLLVLLVSWWPLLTEGRGNLPKNSRTGGWAARALFLVNLFCALIGTAAAVRIVLYGS